MRCYLLSLLLLIPTITFSQVYEGTLGKYVIYLEVDTDFKDGSAKGYYFYNSKLKNIELDGSFDKNKFILFDKYATKEDEKELFTLTLKNNKLIGTWKNNGKSLPVSLTEYATNLDTIKTKKLSLTRDSTSNHNKKQLVWFTEKYSNQQLFRLGNGFTKAERAFFNPLLDKIQYSDALATLNCDYYEITLEVTLVSDTYISYREFSTSYCGGAHPNHISTGYTFDLKNMVKLENITDVYPKLNLYQSIKNKYESNSSLDTECNYFEDKSVWEYYSWFFTDKGAIIIPSYPHAMTPCEEDFFLSYKELTN